MSTTTIIVIIVLLLVFGGGGYGYYSTRSSVGGPGRVVVFNPAYGIGGLVVSLLVLWLLFHFALGLI
jgi:hypothetical protein